MERVILRRLSLSRISLICRYFNLIYGYIELNCVLFHYCSVRILQGVPSSHYVKNFSLIALETFTVALQSGSVNNVLVV